MMWKFYKQEEKLPFSYPAIEERRTNPNYLGWIIGIILLIGTGFVIYLLL